MFVRFGRASATSLIFAALLLSAMTWPSDASAQGIFQAFFAAFQQPAADQPLPPRMQAYASPAPAAVGPEGSSIGSGRAVAYCVRLCDGRYFPIQRNVSATPVQLCNALCPASKTKVFSGGDIHGAVGADGSRYADLANAFVFRERLVASCTCNGKDAFGLAPLDVAADPTLRRGDVVTTENGLMTVTGTRMRKGSTQIAAFTPVGKSNLSADLRHTPSGIAAAPTR